MHNCAPPAKALKDWLSDYPSVDGAYGHLLLEQNGTAAGDLVEKLRPYFESAHLDARQHFHDQIGLDLHPDASAPGSHAVYPTCLPPITRRGLFGEVMAGLLTEHYQNEFVGAHRWQVPVFLFRHHAAVEAFLFDFARDGDRTRQMFGRFGSDFIGIELDSKREVVRFIVGEAKWRHSLSASVVDTLLQGDWIKDSKTGERQRSGLGIWYQLNNAPLVPHGLRQLHRLLQDLDPNGHAAAILSLDRILALPVTQPIARTNLLLIAGNDIPSRELRHPQIPWQNVPAEYTAPHELQVIELYLSEGDALIDQIYDSLWARAE